MQSKLLSILNDSPPMKFGSGACGDWSFSKAVVTDEDALKLSAKCARGEVELLVQSGIPSGNLLEGDTLAEDFVAALNEVIETEEALFEDDLESLEPAVPGPNEVVAQCPSCGPTVSEIKSSKFDENGKQKILKVVCSKCGSKHRYKPATA